MKQCPFCKANIEDNARFCLYCMRPLIAKEEIQPPPPKKPWWLIAAGALLLVLLALLIILAGGQDEPRGASTGSESSESTYPVTESAGASAQNTQSGTDTPPESGGEKRPALPSGSGSASQAQQTRPGSTVQNPAGNATSSALNSQGGSASEGAAGEVANTPPATPPQNPTTVPPTTQPQAPTTAPTAPEPTTAAVVYSYRAAQAYDDINANYSNSGNDIVITGVTQQSADGTYDIPAYIDGKRVMAITKLAFAGTNAKTVYVPATMKSIWNYAFAGCGLTDIYFRGNAVYAENKAFPDSLVAIHCSASCTDRDFNYYKTCAAGYGAVWEEWNG